MWEQGSQAGPKQRRIWLLSSWKNQRAGLVGVQHAWSIRAWSGGLGSGREGCIQVLSEKAGVEVGRETRVSRRLAPGLLARIHILGVGFSEAGLKWKLEGLLPRGPA